MSQWAVQRCCLGCGGSLVWTQNRSNVCVCVWSQPCLTHRTGPISLSPELADSLKGGSFPGFWRILRPTVLWTAFRRKTPPLIHFTVSKSHQKQKLRSSVCQHFFDFIFLLLTLFSSCCLTGSEAQICSFLLEASTSKSSSCVRVTSTGGDAAVLGGGWKHNTDCERILTVYNCHNKE